MTIPHPDEEISYHELAPMTFDDNIRPSSDLPFPATDIGEDRENINIDSEYLRRLNKRVFFVDHPLPLMNAHDKEDNLRDFTRSSPIMTAKYSMFGIKAPTHDQVLNFRGKISQSSYGFYFRADDDNDKLKQAIIRILKEITVSEDCAEGNRSDGYNYSAENIKPFFPSEYNSFVDSHVCFKLSPSKCSPTKVFEVMLNIIKFGGILNEIDVNFAVFSNNTHSVTVVYGKNFKEEWVSNYLKAYIEKRQQMETPRNSIHDHNDIYFVPGRITYHLKSRDAPPPYEESAKQLNNKDNRNEE
ncbi:hypothetical protein BN7_368 [Wickerhamomyces ciferrii]|uniref:Uncharacterized protein n=1 Tax=Wickerhamomyces ciferrii (strain ATCC 14091 / BCRC 22168 / CBS 111 / JCM 3599 / NBRC 0793 / NRRL Y-1031 F-60-10) TaxID=1206466 RepID=K0KHJ9_WICCF|nr:uncharacterized protein BN7_368 [Wickerhamomyces ciferrii]CCH40834.1 hypothetical protein BN7_368 [Wickerhamomyces ciferrii]